MDQWMCLKHDKMSQPIQSDDASPKASSLISEPMTQAMPVSRSIASLGFFH